MCSISISYIPNLAEFVNSHYNSYYNYIMSDLVNILRIISGKANYIHIHVTSDVDSTPIIYHVTHPIVNLASSNIL